MAYYPKIVEELIERLQKLPGIGRKSAERLANHLLAADKQAVEDLAANLVSLKDSVGLCRTCFNLAEGDFCGICRDDRRNKTICVVEEVKDLIIMEKTGYDGGYHVLGGRISTLDNIGPEDIRIAQLVERLKNGGIDEIIIATNPNPEGEDTARYLSDILKGLGLKHSRLAYGLPVGAEIEYVDAETLKRSLHGRKTL